MGPNPLPTAYIYIYIYAAGCLIEPHFLPPICTKHVKTLCEMRFFFLEKSPKFVLRQMGFIYAPMLFVPHCFSGTTSFLLWNWSTELPKTRAVGRVWPFFPANAGGSEVVATYLGGMRVVALFLAFFFGACGLSIEIPQNSTEPCRRGDQGRRSRRRRRNRRN